MIEAIVNKSKPAWYCKRCHVSHEVLYMNGKERYCENCVPAEVKSKAVYMNQMREPIKYNKEGAD